MLLILRCAARRRLRRRPRLLAPGRRFSSSSPSESSSCTSPVRLEVRHGDRQEKSGNSFHPAGKTWTTLMALAAGHFNSYRQYEPGVIGIGTQPPFAIGQRALLV
jgi:hypothetical protein